MRFIWFIFLLCAFCASAVSSVSADNGLTIDGTASLTLDSTTAITITGGITGTGTFACTGSNSVEIYAGTVGYVNWGVATFTPATSSIAFYGESGDTADFYITANNRTFYNLTIAVNAAVTDSSSAGLDITQALTITNEGALNLGTNLTHNLTPASTVSGTLNLGLSTLSCAGNLTIASGATLAMNASSAVYRPRLQMANGTTLTINGDLITTWSAIDLKSVITSTVAGARFSFTVNGKIDANGVIIAATTNGLNITASADTTSDLDNIDFQDTAGGARHLYIGFTSGTYTGNYDACSFDNSFGGGYNAVCANTAGSTVLYFSDWSGPGGGEPYESQGTNTSIVWIGSDTMVSNGSAAVILESTAAITVPGDFNIAIVTCTGPAGIYVAGDWGVVTFTPGASTVYFTGGTQDVVMGAGTTGFYNLDVRSSDGQTAAGSNIAIAAGGALSVSAQSAGVNGSYTLDGGTVTLGQNAAVNVNANAKLKGVNSASITSSNPGTDRFAFNVAGTIELNGCYITSANGSGLNIQSGATIDALKDIKFYSHPGGATDRFLSIAVPSLNSAFLGCWFDTITAGYNVYATGAGSIISFELYNAGPGAGEARDYDNDANDDGVADSGGAVVLWLQRSVVDTESAGGIQGWPTIAFDLNTYAYYSTYVVSRDISGAGTNDRLYVLDTNGSQKYSYDVRQVYGDVVSTPWWYTEGTAHTVYFGTTQGYLFRMIDTGSALAVSSGWPIKVCTEVTSQVISDGINLYFGGMDGATYKIYAYDIATVSQLFGLTAVSRISTTPSWAIDSGTTYLFIGSDYKQLAGGIDGQLYNTETRLTSATANFIANGVTAQDVLAVTSGTQQGRYRILSVDSATQVTTDYTATGSETGLSFSAGRTVLYRVNVTAKVIDKQNITPMDHLRSPIVYWEYGGNKNLFAGDYYGRLQGVEPFSVNFTDQAGFPAVPSYGPYSITAMAYVKYLTSSTFRIVYADMGGWFYDRDMAGALYDPDGGGPITPYPLQLGGGTAIESSPMPGNNDIIYIGNNDGKVFGINEAQKTVAKTYSFGAGVKIGDIGYDMDNSRLLVPTSAGKIYYIQD